MIGKLFVALVLISCGKAAAYTELDQFFPTSSIHEDDRITGDFEAIINGCSVELTEVSGAFTTVSSFNVHNYETDPGRLTWPFANQLSTRYNVVWRARPPVADGTIEELSATLRELSVSLRDQRTLSPDELQAKSRILENWLSDIRSGGHGPFAMQNHTARYMTADQNLLRSVRINTVMGFPVHGSDMASLAHAMYRHALTCD